MTKKLVLMILLALILGGAALYGVRPLLQAAGARDMTAVATVVPSPPAAAGPRAGARATPTASAPATALPIQASPTPAIPTAALPAATDLPTAPPTSNPADAPAEPADIAVVFQSPADGSLQVIDGSAGSLAVLADATDAGQRLPWAPSPDGRAIAVITGRDWHNHSLSAALWIVGVDATAPRKLLDLLGAGSPLDPEQLRLMLTDERAQQLIWTADGQSISVTSAHEGDLDRYAVSLRDGSVQRLDQHSGLAPRAEAGDAAIPAGLSAPGTIQVGSHGGAHFFFAPADAPETWQLYREIDHSSAPIGPALTAEPVAPRLVVRAQEADVDPIPPTPAPTLEPMPESTPESAPPAPGLEELRASLGELVAGWPGEHAVSVTDLQTGQTIAVNGDRPQIAACTLKIPLMMAVAQDIEAGLYTAEEIDGLVRSAMGPSNTLPARELISLVGGGDIGAGLRRINQLMWDLGATGSIITHPPGYFWEEYGYLESHGIASNLLTAADATLILGELYRGEALSPAATEYVLWSMSLAPDWMNDSLGAPLPAEATLYHKIGQLYEPENTWNDAGIVVFERGGQRYAYAIAYLGSYDATWQDSYVHAMTVSDLAWRYFDSQY